MKREIMKNKRQCYFSLSFICTSVFIASLLIPNVATAAFQYVRAGASGNNDGSDWTNAFTALPETLVRGDTYYIADGSYVGYIFNDAVSGTLVITVKKAIESDHGTDTGWLSTYGDGVATFTSTVQILTSYITFDGQVGGGPGSWETGHGFEIDGGTSSPYALLEMTNPGDSNITIQHVNMHFDSAETPLDSRSDGIRANVAHDMVQLDHCFIHDVRRVFLLKINQTNWTVEFNKFARNRSTADIHGEAVSTRGGGNYIYRWNIFEDFEGTGGIVNLSGTTSNWDIYGNVFIDTGAPTVGTISNGLVTERSAGASTSNVKFYNNTIVGIRGLATGLRFFSGSSTNNVAQNNIWWNCENVSLPISESHNYFGENCTFLSPTQPATLDPTDQVDVPGDPFMDSANGDFRLVAGTAAGFALGAPFNIDPDDATRGSDGNWDRGAYEFPGIITGDVVPPAPPVGLSIASP